MPEKESAAMQLTLSWEVSTKVSCDTLAFMVGASKPTLEESFDAQTDILVASDENSKEICVPEK